MHVRRNLKFLVVGLGVLAAGCATRQPPPVVPAAFVARGLSAPYLYADVIGGTRARAAKLRAAKIRPIAPTAVGVYMSELDAQLRQQTAGIGVDVLRIGDSILIRIPASLTFDPASSSVKPQFDATLLEIARTVKTRDKTFVDVFAHTDTIGTPQVNQTLSDKRAASVATYLAGHGVAKARIASKGFGESAPLYVPDLTETDRAANRRVEIRLTPYRG